jgi:hypothetical protein
VRRWPSVLLFAGLIVQIVTWSLVVPAYATYDEFDHVFRASGAAHGYPVALRHTPPEYPSAVAADRRLVTAGTAECLGLPYTSQLTCNPGPALTRDLVTVHSGAAYYNPLYYLAVGPASRLGVGVNAVLWMRALSITIAAVIIGWAILLVSRWRRPDAAIRGLALAASPMLLFSMAIVAPNGLEMAAGVLWWVALLTVTRREAAGPLLWSGLALSGLLLATLRSLGPLWLVLPLVLIGVWRPRRQLSAIWREYRRAVVVTLAVVGAALTASIGWILTQHAQVLREAETSNHASGVQSVLVMVRYTIVLVVQFVAAIPGRNLAPPPIVTAAWLVPFALVLLNVDRRHVRGLRALSLLIVFVVVIPLGFGFLTYARLGIAWQSRYQLPLAVGIPLLAAILGMNSRSRLLVNDLILTVAMPIASVAIMIYALNWYDQDSPLARQHVFPLVPGPLAVGLIGTASLCCGLAVLAAARRSRPDEPRTAARVPELLAQ